MTVTTATLRAICDLLGVDPDATFRIVIEPDRVEVSAYRMGADRQPVIVDSEPIVVTETLERRG